MDDFCAELKAQREASGLSVDDLFERTRINPTFLDALEAGNFDILPEAYTRLFLKKYAQEIGLNPREILGRYEALRRPSDASDSQSPPPKRARVPSTGLMLVIAFGLVLAVGIGTMALKNRDRSASSKATSKGNARTAVQLPSPPGEAARGETSDSVSPSNDVPSGAPFTQREIPQTPVGEARPPSVRVEAPSPGNSLTATGPTTLPTERVVVAYSLSIPLPSIGTDSLLILAGRALQTTRVTVLADGEPIFDGTLSAGQKRLWNARSRFRIEVENAPGVAFSLQGHAFNLLGKPGRKLRLSISRSSIWVEEVEPSPSSAAVDF
jgi:cytoskeletal protein RodZ